MLVHTCTCMSHDVEHVQYICVLVRSDVEASSLGHQRLLRQLFLQLLWSELPIHPDPSVDHLANPWSLLLLSTNFLIPMFFAVGTPIYNSLKHLLPKKTAPGHSKHFPSNFNYNPWISDCSWCLSHTYRNPHSVWSLILAWDSWSFSCSIESQEFTQKKIFNMWQKFWNRQRVSNQHVKFTTILQVSGNISP